MKTLKASLLTLSLLMGIISSYYLIIVLQAKANTPDWAFTTPEKIMVIL